VHKQQSDLPSVFVQKGRKFLDQVYQQMQGDTLSVAHTMSNLLSGLHEIRRELPPDDWQTFCKQVVPKHDLAKLIHQDPFTFHSVRKPRGYAGDAALLDYIYGHSKATATPLGERIFEFTTNTAPCRAVRTRSKIIAGIIDRLAQERREPLRILSIACGHLREADTSQAVQAGRVAEYVAFDQDAESLAEVGRRLKQWNVRTVRGSIVDLLMGRHRSLEGFHLVYAAGLYDYLSQRLATRMTSWMFNATRPGGTTLLTNFLSGIGGAGYMEAFMDWELIFRTPEELGDTASRIPVDAIGGKRVYSVDGEVVFVELNKLAHPGLSSPQRFRPVGQPSHVAAAAVGRTDRKLEV
jgi:extracellular factor (EF) 3-hydroxypalmitic acid methyl ester biosynthesis protein